MKAKRITIGIKTLDSAFNDFEEATEAIQNNSEIKAHTGVYFTDFEAFRRALTPKRLELLRIIKTKKPESINQLARIADRNIKNIATDVDCLVQIGLVEKTKTSDNKKCPSVSYNTIHLDIAI